MTNITERIRKLQLDIANLKEVYKLPRNIEGGRTTYNEIFPDRNDKNCPKCGYDFGKSLQRAKRCPKCDTYLHVRYGHLLLDEDDDFYLHQIRLAVLCWAYAAPDGPQFRSIEGDADGELEEYAHKNIDRFYEEMKRLI